jgi:hypothetical protein
MEIERDARLSSSILWRVQRRYYDRVGIDAWRKNLIPSAVTNSPALARAHAEVVLGLLRDGEVVRGEPLTIVELGAGSGRLGFLFLKTLLDLLARSSLGEVRIRYVLTDFTESNLAFWREHPALAAFFARGVLDLARFDAESDASIRLERSGEAIGPGALANPLVVVANYLFDVIPQDAFTRRGGVLHESLVSITVKDGCDIDAPRVEPFEGFTFRYAHRPAPGSVYPERDLELALQDCAASLAEGETFLFPSAGLRCLSRLAELARGRLLLLLADRDHREDAYTEEGHPEMAVHRAVSFSVSFRAVASFVRVRGGSVLAPDHRPPGLRVSAFTLGFTAGPETRLAFERSVERSTPSDLMLVREMLEPIAARLATEDVLALLRLSRDDPRVLGDLLPVLAARVGSLLPETRREVLAAIVRAWDNHFELGEPRDLALEIGRVLEVMGEAPLAFVFFERSRARRPAD